jgi:hypothetical protein
MMIPQWLVDYVHGPVLSWIGTRDARLRPSVSWAFGALVAPATDEITTFVPEAEIADTRANLEHNGLVAFTCVEPVSHQAYQFKGRLVALRPTTEEERAVQEIYRDKMVTHFVTHTHFPAEAVTGFRFHPSTAITFRVEEVFVQTPGPGAGNKVDLAAG